MCCLLTGPICICLASTSFATRSTASTLRSAPHSQTRVEALINGAAVDYNDDGSWRIVIAETDPGHPNWVSTAGRSQGLMWLRWFLPERTPDRPVCRVVDIAEVSR